MSKISYSQLAIEVEKLYQKEFDVNDNNGIINHCEFIRNFIESCGWSIEDYISRMWVEDRN